mgnify:CR=1 FL=1
MERGAPPSRMCSVSARWTGTGEGDRKPEHDLDEAAKAAGGVAECERQAGRDDDDNGDDLGDRTFNRLENFLKRLFPRHRRTGGVSDWCEDEIDGGNGDSRREGAADTDCCTDHAGSMGFEVAGMMW